MNLLKRHSVLLDQVIFSGGNFLFTILAARFLGAEMFGEFSGIILAQYFLLSLSQAFIGQPFQVVFQKDEPRNHSVFTGKWNFNVNLTISLLACLIGFATMIFHHLNWGVVTVASAGAFGLLLNDFYRKKYIVTNPLKAVFQDAAIALIQIAGLILVYYYELLNLYTLVAVYFVSYVPVICIASIDYWNSLDAKISTEKVSNQYRREWKWLFPTALIQWMAGNFLVAASGALLGPPALAAMRLTQTLFGVLNIGLQVVENNSIPEAVERFRSGNGILQIYLKGLTRKLMIWGIPFLSIIFFFSAPVLSYLLGGDYDLVSPLMKGMSILYVLILLGYPVRIGVRVTSMGKNFLIGYIATAVLSVVLVYPLVQLWDAMGIIVGLAINQLVMQIYWLFMLQRNGVSLLPQLRTLLKN
jgi:O-antigen/teichoic acid export membrane protein